jgi:glycosyltransferase involved in cell wall biosynthesis
MRVLILNYEYPPLGGGAGKALKCMLEEFAVLYPGLSADIVTASEGAAQKINVSEKITVYKLDIGKRDAIHFQTIGNLLNFLWKANSFSSWLIEQKKFDLIHCFFSVPTGIIGYWKRKNIPYIVSLRGSDVPYYNERFSMLYKIISPVITRVCKNASAVISNSQALKELALTSMPELTIGVIPNGITAAQYPRIRENNDDRLRLIFVGRLIQRKGCEYLIRALSKIQSEKHIDLDIVGYGDREFELKSLVKELSLEGRVSFHGEVRGDALIRLYQQADAFVLPS